MILLCSLQHSYLSKRQSPNQDFSVTVQALLKLQFFPTEAFKSFPPPPSFCLNKSPMGLVALKQSF